MENIVTLFAEKLTGWDFLFAGIIVLIVEYGVKLIFKNADEKTWNIVVKVAPIVLGVILYIVIALIQKNNVLNSILHGLFVGLTAMGSYDLILKTVKESGVKSVSDVNTSIKDALENK